MIQRLPLKFNNAEMYNSGGWICHYRPRETHKKSNGGRKAPEARTQAANIPEMSILSSRAQNLDPEAASEDELWLLGMLLEAAWARAGRGRRTRDHTAAGRCLHRQIYMKFQFSAPDFKI